MDESTVGILILVCAILGMLFSVALIIKYFITHDILTGEEKKEKDNGDNSSNNSNS